MTRSVYVIEDEGTTRELCIRFLESALPELNVLGACADGHEAYDACLELQPDLIIIDIGLPDMSGLELLSKFKKNLPDTRILVYSGVECSEVIKSAWIGQADGFVEKSLGMNQMKEAIESVFLGKPYFTQVAAAKIIDLSVSQPIPPK
ncbi:MAG: response regulator transcription factor [Verrucomicrobiota bacterium]